MKSKHFMGLMGMLIGSSLCVGLQAQVVRSKTVENGGTGPYKAIAAQEQTLPNFVVYRPADLKEAVKEEGKLPIMVFGNGACADNSLEHENMLSEIASHGYVVIAIGALQMQKGEAPHQGSEASRLINALDWIVARSTDRTSEYYKMVNTKRIASGGMSCGGAQVMATCGDPRIRTYIMFNSGMGNVTMAGANSQSLAKLHGPILYMLGGVKDIAHGNALIDYDRISQVPVAFSDHPNCGHGGTYAQPHGGSFCDMALRWLNWQLKGQKKYAKTFLKNELEDFPGWSMKAKNF